MAIFGNNEKANNCATNVEKKDTLALPARTLLCASTVNSRMVQQIKSAQKENASRK
jgi:hypothetical protein